MVLDTGFQGLLSGKHRLRKVGIMVSARLIQVLSIVTILSGTVVSLDVDAATEMRIGVVISQQSYTSVESIVTRVDFKNMGSHSITLNTAFNVFPDCKLTFDIVTPSGRKPVETLPLLGRRKLLSREDFVNLDPGEKFEVEIPLSKWYQLNEKGLYKLSAEYGNSNTGAAVQSLFGRKINAWVGQIRSESTSFRILDR